MSNMISVNQLLAKNSLASMHNKLVFIRTVDRQLDAQWAKPGYGGFKPGKTFSVNRPARVKTSTGAAIGVNDIQNFVEDPVQLTVSDADRVKTAHQFDSTQLTLELTNEKSRIGDPQGKQIATDVEKKIVRECVAGVGNYIVATGNATLGTKIGVQDLLDAEAYLNALACPEDGRSCLISPFAMAQLSRENLTLFTPVQNAEVYLKGYIRQFAGADLYNYNLLPSITIPAIATPIELAASVVDGASTLSLTVAAGDIGKVLPAGTILEFGGYDAVNPETRESFGKSFAVGIVESVTLSATTVVKLATGAKIYGPDDEGYRQCVTALPVAGDVVTVVGAGKKWNQVVMYQMDAFTSTVIPLETDLPGADAARADYDGISIRVSRQYDKTLDTVVTRFDAQSKGILQRQFNAVRVLVEA